MADRTEHILDFNRKPLLLVAGLMTVVAPIVLGQVKATQNPSILALTPPPPAAWMTAIAVQRVSSHANPVQSGTGPQAGNTASTLPEFEVASIKPMNPKRPSNMGIGLYVYPGGKVVASDYPLLYLLTDAFDVQAFQISGPRWINEDRYEIEATPPASSQSSRSNPADFVDPPNNEQRQMLLALLIDRFQLKFHRETKDGPVYFLVKGRKDLKLQAPKDRNARSWAGGVEGGGIYRGTGLAGRNISMPQLAARLSGFLKRPVLDQTRLKGSFDFEFRTGNDDPDADVIYSILTSIQGIGLRLQPGKGPVETIVVDHIEKPSEN